MALISCPECGKQISDKAPNCPNCGYPINAVAAQNNNPQENNSKRLDNLYARARKSLEVNDLEHAAEYYTQILDENPQDWEAYFYSYLGEFATYTNAQAGSVASKLENTIPAAYDMAIQNCDTEEAVRRIEQISSETADRLWGIAQSAANLISEYEGGNILFASGKVNIDMYQNLRPMVANTMICVTDALDALDAKLCQICEGDSGITKAQCKDALLCVRRARFGVANTTFSPSAGEEEYLISEEWIVKYAKQLKELDPEIEVPTFEQETSASDSGNAGGGGCYVATAVYGSYDCPEVWTLRRFRDHTLAKSWYGRAFIKTYYAISPTLVKWFGHTAWFKRFWKTKLDKMVSQLRASGVEDSPYADKNWN